MIEAKLVVVGGEADSTEIRLNQLPATLGRGRDATVTLAHPLISRHHCEIYESAAGLMVKDLGSLNGTFVGSKRIEKAELPPGELLTIGTVTFRAVYGDTAQTRVRSAPVAAVSETVGANDATISVEPAGSDVEEEIVSFDDIETVEEVEEIADFAEVAADNDTEDVAEVEEVVEFGEADDLDEVDEVEEVQEVEPAAADSSPVISIADEEVDIPDQAQSGDSALNQFFQDLD